ncbi:MAG: M42 family metallopeptidase [Oscillospiraceae bacterium]|jgi:endoglucanase|nr:M42 family metallopeptidase [Oscillospiraceae bacterium]
MIKRLKELCAIDGVSGWEDAVRDYLREAAEPYADEIRVDTMGNLLVFRKGAEKNAGRTLMVEAHMDEVGLIVRGATDDGYLKFGTAGGIDRRVLLAKTVRCGSAKIPGVIGVKPVHMLKSSEKKTIPDLNDLYIDIGASGKDDALKKVPLGEPCAFDTVPEEFGKGFFKAKAIDDRAGCAAALRLLTEEPPTDTWFAFTAQEEVGLRGSRTAAYAVNPDAALILEGTTAADLPGSEGAQSVCAPGKGVVISYMDGSAVYDRALFEKLRNLADAEKIPWQLKKTVAGGTDAGGIQRSRRGVPVAGLAAAVRYIHAPVSVASLEDIENLYKLAKRFINERG